ncbi:MAG TPA: hypothetical protein IGR15_06145 [Synechococcus sp. M44_DOE_062]|nr:hypothetical protein [Synechococcus sp. M44_DOE_062]
MHWPGWLPSPFAWLRAFALLALLAFVAVVGRMLLFWGTVASAIFENKILLGVAFALTLGVMAGLVAHVHHWLKGPEDKRHPTLRSWREGIVAVGLAGASLAMTTVCLLPFFAELEDLPRRSATKLVGFLWLVWAAYLYQLEGCISQYLSQRKDPLKGAG